MDCCDLDPESHTILAHLDKVGWRRNERRLYKTTRQKVADNLGINRGPAYELLMDLERLGFIVLPGDNRVGHPEDRGDSSLCSCQEDFSVDTLGRDRLGSDADRPRTHSKQRSGAERGSGRDARPPSEGGSASRTSRASETCEEVPDEVPPEPPESSPSKAQRRREAALSKSVENLNSFDLAYLLSYRIREVGRTSRSADGWVRAGAVSHTPLRAAIARWMREDRVEPEVIREMIEVFVEEQRLLEQPFPAWKTFIRHRAQLESDARRRLGGYDPGLADADLLSWAEIERRQQSQHPEH